MRKIPYSKITDSVYLINEFDGTNIYLVIGDEKALLIDVGTGVADLKGTVEEITDKPIVVVGTHGHCDHIGGAGQFSEVYVHEDDCTPFIKVQHSYALRKWFVKNSFMVRNGITVDDLWKWEQKTKFISISEGHVFDLGNCIVKVHHTPGHSKGSIALIDERDKIIFSGDNVCDAVWLQLPGSTSIEEWLTGAQWLYEMSREYRVFWGHRTPELESDYIGTVVGWGKELVAKTEKNTLFYKKDQYPKQKDGIVYRTDKVLKKAR